MTDPRDPQTEDQIRRALSARAQEIRVSPDALDAIRSRRSPNPWSRPIAYAAVAAMAVALLVGVTVLTGSDDTSAPDDVATESTTVPPDTSTPTTSTPTTSTTAPTTTTTPTTTGDAPGPSSSTRLGIPISADPARSLALWDTPAGLTAQEAVEAFIADRFGLTDATVSPTTVELDGGVPTDGVEAFGVHRRGEDGTTLDSFAFTVVTHTTAGSAPKIAQVVTEAFRIDHAALTGDGMRVTGAGRAYEGTAILDIQGTETLLAVGATELAGFSVVAPLGEHCPCIVTITGDTGFAGAVPEITSYRINPAAAATYSVFGVADDDTLNVRTGAGVDNAVLTTFPPDATDIVLTGRDAMVGSARWVEVETEDARGWVNRQFLVADHDLPSAQEQGLVDDYVAQLRTLDPALFASVVDIGGIGVYADFPTPWTSVGRDDFDVARNWSPVGTEDRCPTCTATVGEFLGVDTARWELAEYTLGSGLDPANPNHMFESGLRPDFHDRYVTGSVYIPEPNPDEQLDWRRYTVVFDFVNGNTPVIRAVWRWGWTP